ncbi:hypothetical protein [Micromonospora zhanjiangensis]|uniref:Gluconate 2-dehydrogenase subunit 3 n=1 Tax=Micromonospora zhanjiangensis TaxID=1522057 RepID=A0ABV8KKP5_9ACTN
MHRTITQRPVSLLRRGADAYCLATDLPIFHLDPGAVTSDARIGRRIAAAYLAGPAADTAAEPAYRAFRAETAAQFEFLTRSRGRGGLGIEVLVQAEDPYPDAAAMTSDLRDFGLLRVYGTAGCGNPHPYLSNDDNDMFRAVHDAFGHAATGRGFDRHGEEAAWLKHATMYSPLARQAMTTETRGQTCVFFYYFKGERFPRQKMFVLPEPFWRLDIPPATGGGERG